MLYVTRRRKAPATHKAGNVTLRPERPRIGANYRKPPPAWQTTITQDQLWVQDIYLNRPVSSWTWYGRWGSALNALLIVALVIIFYQFGMWVRAGMPTGY
jgi:hypothetical protein